MIPSDPILLPARAVSTTARVGSGPGSGPWAHRPGPKAGRRAVLPREYRRAAGAQSRPAQSVSGRLQSSEAAPSQRPQRATPPSHDADRRRPIARPSAHRRRISPPPFPGSSRRPAPAARSALALPPRVHAFVPSPSASFAPTPAFLRNAGTVGVVPILTFDQHLTNRQPRGRRGRAPHRSGCAEREKANRRAAPFLSSDRAGRAAGHAPAGPRR